MTLCFYQEQEDYIFNLIFFYHKDVIILIVSQMLKKLIMFGFHAYSIPYLMSVAYLGDDYDKYYREVYSSLK